MARLMDSLGLLGTVSLRGLCGAEFLAEAIVQFAGDAAALFVLSDKQAARQMAKLVVEELELASFTMEFGEDADFGAQELGIDWDGDVINGTALVALKAIEIGEV